MTQNIAVVGAGYWGKNLIRNHFEIGSLKMICDNDDAAISPYQEQYPNVTFTADFNEVISNHEIHAIVLATPAAAHYDMAKRALQAGKHVFVEKPLALELGQG
jgi:UDP-2-acetamido-3-amino-2,3-dideoxy-glucuronate N-acetyltransferase